MTAFLLTNALLGLESVPRHQQGDKGLVLLERSVKGHHKQIDLSVDWLVQQRRRLSGR
jgi:hypothetical protein